MRLAFSGSAPIFAMPDLAQPTGTALLIYVLLGALIGQISVWVTRAVYAVEDAFDKLPIHWMWWPALGAVAVGVVGYFAPHTMGVGYDNIDHILGGELVGRDLTVLSVLKLISWAISLGSGTSGGTLAPLFTIGGGLGALLGTGAALVAPSWGIDPRAAALVGMAAMFAGASRALLTSVVFAFETTRQAAGLLPLLGGCTAAYLVSCLLMRHTIMTEKIARRGVRVLAEYSVDFLDQVLVRDHASRPVRLLAAGDTLAKVRAWLASGAHGSSRIRASPSSTRATGCSAWSRAAICSTSRASLDSHHRAQLYPPRAGGDLYADSSLRQAADRMVRESVGRLPVVTRDAAAQAGRRDHAQRSPHRASSPAGCAGARTAQPG